MSKPKYTVTIRVCTECEGVGIRRFSVGRGVVNEVPCVTCKGTGTVAKKRK